MTAAILGSYISLSRGLLTSLSYIWLLVLSAVVWIGGALLLLFILRHYGHRWRSSSDAVVIAGIAAMVLTLFALLLAFGIVSLYNQRQEAQQAIAHEADDLAQVKQDATVLTTLSTIRSSKTETVDSAVRRYACIVETHEFPAMAAGQTHRTLTPKPLQQIFTALAAYQPRGTVEDEFYRSSVTQLNDAVAQRRDRLESVNTALPFAFTTLLVLTAIVSILLTCFVRTSGHEGDKNWHGRVEYILVGSVAFVVSAGLLTTLLFEFPFSGPLALTSHLYALVHGC